MSLGKIQATPTYECKIGTKKVRYRPFTVREERALLLAQNTENVADVVASMVEVVKACVLDEKVKNDLSASEFEYLFLMIRAKSVGEESTVIVNCSCDKKAETTVTINLLETKLEIEKQEPKIQITDDIQLVLKNLSSEDLIDVAQAEESERDILSIMRSIKTVVHGDSVYETSEEPENELREFVQTLTRNVKGQIETFIKAAPKVSLPVKWVCSTCGREQETTLKGIDNFF